MSASLDRRRLLQGIAAGLPGALLCAEPASAGETAGEWLQATAHLVPKETATEGEGYFSIIEGHNRRLYVGTHANGVNAWLVEFDPEVRTMRIVVDAQKEIGTSARGFAAQAKIHTRNNVGKSGRIYFGTKQGYPGPGEKREDYPGGYPMVYDPKTCRTRVYPIPVPHQGINSITPDEERGVAYVSTCSDRRPGPEENAVFLLLDLKTGAYKQLLDTRHYYGFIVLDYRGRAYHPVLGGAIARYDPTIRRVELLRQTIDGRPPAAETRLALTPQPDPINWDVSPDRKTLYALPMSGNGLYAYDLTAEGDTLPGRSLGPLIQGTRATDCRGMCAGPSGCAWAAVTEAMPDGVQQLHLVRYRPGERAPRDLGRVAVSNPDFTRFTDGQGKPLPFHDGLVRRPDGITVTRHVTMGICEARSGSLFILALHPYMLLEIPREEIRRAERRR